MGLRTSLCFEFSRRLLPQPAKRTTDYSTYQDWRKSSLAGSWRFFAATDLVEKDILDFGCGDGALSLHLATTARPRRVIGVDLNQAALERARLQLQAASIPFGTHVDFVLGSEAGLPLGEACVDAIVAFDCLEHVMAPDPIFKDWYRVLRPGGKCLIEWFPFKGPWGPHMESLIPIPWAHVLFGEKAMFRAAERIYDLPSFVPRHWDLDDQGNKKPNKWRAWSSFKQQGYVNELDLAGFRTLASRAGLAVERLELHSFGGSAMRRRLGQLAMNTPIVGEYFVSFAIVELRKPALDR